MAKYTFETGGITFKLRPTSPKVVKEIRDYDKGMDAEEEAEGMDLEGATQYYEDILRLIAEPVDPNAELDKDLLDFKEVEDAMGKWIPRFVPIQSVLKSI